MNIFACVTDETSTRKARGGSCPICHLGLPAMSLHYFHKLEAFNLLAFGYNCYGVRTLISQFLAKIEEVTFF